MNPGGDLRHPATDRDPAVDGELGRLPVRRRRHQHPDPESAPDRVRRAYHCVSGARAGRPQPALAQHPELFPGLAVLVLNWGNKEGGIVMRSFKLLLAGAAAFALFEQTKAPKENGMRLP